MTSMQRPSRRRNARHAFNEGNGDEDGEGNKEGYGSAPTKRTKVDGSSAKATVGAQTKSKKKNAAYDEDIDGFQFSRTRSKRIQAMELATNTAAAPTSAVTAEAKTRSDAKAITTKVPSKRKKGPSAIPTAESANSQTQPPPRRSARLSADKEVVSLIAPAPAPAPPINSQHSTEKAERTKQLPKHTSPPKEAAIGFRDRLNVVSPPIPNQIRVEKKRKATKIALPFADTPIIQRNKDMRKNSGQGHRRSSNGMRGRRASSLIEENKSNAFPHAEVETREFYKHIAQDLLEPKRMKQLLVWCGSRALSEKPLGNVEDANERMTARTIQEELLKEFATNSDLSDVFSKRDVTSGALVKRPNPRNIQNANKLKELERELERLKAQKREWDQLMSSSKAQLIPFTRSTFLNSTNTKSNKSKAADLSSIDSSLLSPSESNIFNTLLSLKTQSPGLDKRLHQQSKAQQKRPEPTSNTQQQQQLLNALSTPSSKSTTTTLPSKSQTQSFKSPHIQYSTSNTKYLSSSSHNESDSETQNQAQTRPTSQVLESQITSPSPSATSTVTTSHPLQRMHHLATTLEPTIDSLAEGVHRLAQYKIAAERVARDASVLASGALSAHDRQIKERSGTAKVDVKDVLGALSSAIVEAEIRAKGRG